MYCPECQCEYSGWDNTCPICKSPLVKESVPDHSMDRKTISIEDLKNIVLAADGKLEVDVWAAEVTLRRKWSFPFLGYGYAWIKNIKGVRDEVQIQFKTSNVGKSRSWGFPYFGFGFAWEQEMKGEIGGNPVTLKAVKVQRKKKWRFPFLGYGYAWTEKMEGVCDSDMKIELNITEYTRRQRYGFPYFGFGFSWGNRGVLTLKIT